MPHVGVRMPQSEIDRLAATANKLGLPKSELARRYIEAGLDAEATPARDLTKVPTATLLAEIATRVVR